MAGTIFGEPYILFASVQNRGRDVIVEMWRCPLLRSALESCFLVMIACIRSIVLRVSRFVCVL